MAISTIGGATNAATGDLGSNIVAAFQVPASGNGKFAVTGGLPAGSYVIVFRGSTTTNVKFYGYVGTVPSLLAENVVSYMTAGSTGSVGLNNYNFTTTAAFDGLYIVNFVGAVIVRKWTAATSATLTANNWAAFGSNFPSTSMISPYSVASSGSTIVAVNYTSGPFVYVSTDTGSTWNNTATSVSYLGNIGWGNNLFVAAPWGSASASVTTSPTGATWTSRTLTTSRLWQGNPHYAGSLTTPRWIVTGPDGSANISTDGVTWTAATIVAGTNSNPFWTGSGGGIAIALRSGDATYYTSTDLSTWTARTFPTTVSGNPVITYANGTFVVSNISSSTYYTSTNGINWTSKATPFSSTAPILYTNGLFCYGIVQNQPTSSSSSWFSTDLVTWYSRTWASNTNYAGYLTTSTNFFHYLPNNSSTIPAGRTTAALDSLI